MQEKILPKQTNSTSNIHSGEVGSVSYDIFGSPYQKTGFFLADDSLDFGYLGKPYNADTELYDYGFRDYSPEIARFTTVDPIRDGRNWFSYVVNDPVNYVDLWGLCGSDGKKDTSNLLSEFFEIFDDFSVGLREEVAVNIPDYISFGIEINLVSTNSDNDGNNFMDSGMSFNLTLGNENIPIYNFSVGIVNEVQNANCPFELFNNSYELTMESELNEDFIVTLPIPFFSVEINLTEGIDFLGKLADEVINIIKE